ncbi:PilT/PilU family type 4a pilus ATPase [Candidatus Macondimonas diazotrophica]|jgi:twitching motility protein PilU|uniref:PilT/PilU family type 4a pilus ATPase n=2 Tax=Candidatus Macondimonas diazotrophica TaxID=2305248 RepID=A0A4Z0F890_9GAMM|nr:PilT/PilU family type 4a pilus ATPase [Candidatus Macondimonas diazotrophica]TFZ81713.1 PilT/PilU family type 4a pilus ATPase [Candidatus Macondimonas diazotrophica]HBG29714.1 type IV pili twitching motility protein PilT [Gammaproteobacteria bacterium]HBG50196.1 type IV pili twitching motility protein PilT [Gammaproteobacteria bacterium]
MLLKPYLEMMVAQRASDLYLSPGSLPQLRLEGRNRPIGRMPLSADEVARAVDESFDERERNQFRQRWQVDYSYIMPEVGRFRFTAFRQRGQVALVVRYVQPALPRIRDLELPLILQDLALLRQGLILVVGSTGCGKSTTLAATLQHRNEHVPGHILTIEDPIEFFLESRKSVVNQRELGVDAIDYASALRSALRAAPDVIMVGEIRDMETLAATVELAGTGHLVMATLHANNAPQTLDRIANLYPATQHAQLFLDLSLYLRAIISQRLVMGRHGHRLPAVEVMLNTPYIAELIAKGQFDKIKAAMEDSKVRGMQDMDSVLYRLYREELIDKDEALAHADSQPNLEAKIHFSS